MDIILKEDVENLGHKFDIVSVKAGYARNFLIPQGMAVAATKSARKVAEEVARQQAHKAAKALEKGAEVATLTVASLAIILWRIAINLTMSLSSRSSTISRKLTETQRKNFKF